MYVCTWLSFRSELSAPAHPCRECFLHSHSSSIDAVLLKLRLLLAGSPVGRQSSVFAMADKGKHVLPFLSCTETHAARDLTASFCLLQSLPFRSWRRCRLRKSCGACGSPSSMTSASFSATCRPRHWWASVPSPLSSLTGSPAGLVP